MNDPPPKIPPQRNPRSRAEGPKILFTVDVEEDMPGWQIASPIRTDNVTLGLPRLAGICSDLGMRPTWLCTHPVVTGAETARLVGDLVQRGDCELGTHLHPWNTPPYLGLPGSDRDEREVATFLRDLGPERFRAKLEVLHREVAALGGAEPVSFRAGRYGIDAATLAELPPLGYTADTSVTPLSSHAPDGGPDFRSAPQLPYRPSLDDVCRPGDAPIAEIPVSVALTRAVPGLFTRAYVRIPRATRIRGLLSRDFLGLVDFAWLYPARFDLELMKGVARSLVRMGSPVLNVFAHSSEYAVGRASYVDTEDELERCFERTRAFFEFALEELGARPATLAEAAAELDLVPAGAGSGRASA